MSHALPCRHESPPSRAFLLLAVTLALATASGCGRNKFQQEVDTEKQAVKLAREMSQGEYSLITTEELKARLDRQDAPLVVDAMPADDFKREHLPAAKNFGFPKEILADWDDKQTAGQTIEDFARLLGDDKDREIIFYCGFVACARSHNGAVFAKKLGYTNVTRYAGGIFAWKGAGHALESSK